jgi:hypothetical protein
MDLRYHVSWSIRHVVGAVAEGALVVAIVGALVFGVAVVGGGGPAGASAVDARTSTGYSTIDLDTSGSRVAVSSLQRGSSVWFKTRVVGLKGTEYPMVYVECYSKDDGSLLYGQLDHPDAEFVLGGGWSPWYDISPSPAAKCFAHLYAYGGKTKGGRDVIRELTDPALPVLSFHADG